MVDLLFTVSGRAIAPDYADRLWRALGQHLPWLADEPAAGILPLSGTSPGGNELYLSHRSRLGLRIPPSRIAAAGILSGLRLDLGGEIAIGAARRKELLPAKVLYSPFVAVASTDEADFLERCGAELAAAGITAQLVCGKPRRINAAAGPILGHSLMLHGLSPEQSLLAQYRGLGRERKRGCGIFVPHKSIAAVGE